MPFCIIKTTTPTKELAKQIACILVKHKLAACVNIIPNVNSIYEWENEIFTDEECILLIKTKKTLFEEVKDNIIKMHSYDLPEVTMYNIDNGSVNFLDWINNQTK